MEAPVYGHLFEPRFSLDECCCCGSLHGVMLTVVLTVRVRCRVTPMTMTVTVTGTARVTALVVCTVTGSVGYTVILTFSCCRVSNVDTVSYRRQTGAAVAHTGTVPPVRSGLRMHWELSHSAASHQHGPPSQPATR